MATPKNPEAEVEWETVHGGGNVYGILVAVKRALLRAYPEDGAVRWAEYDKAKEVYTSYEELCDDVENWVTVE